LVATNAIPNPGKCTISLTDRCVPNPLSVLSQIPQAARRWADGNAALLTAALMPS
jgi:hypothetical protein